MVLVDDPRSIYDMSAIDWSHLHDFARRVAQQARRPAADVTAEFGRIVASQQTTRKLFREVTSRVQTFVVEQVTLVEGCWILAHRRAEWEVIISADHPFRSRTERYHKQFGLLQDGSLFKLAYMEVETVDIGSSPVRRTVLGDKPVLTQLSEEDVTMFDFAPDYYAKDSGSERVNRDDMFGKNLQYSSKGAGLLESLNRLLLSG